MSLGFGWFLDDEGELERGKEDCGDDHWSRRSTRRCGSTATMSATAWGPLCPSIVVRQLRKKLFPEGTFPDSVALKDGAGLRTEGENLPLQRGVKRPVSVRPPPRARQRRVPRLCKVCPIGHHLF